MPFVCPDCKKEAIWQETDLPEELANLKLEPKPKQILKYLAKYRPQYISKDKLMDLLYFDDLDPPMGNVISVHVSKINKRLSGSGWQISCKYIDGYSLIRKT